MTSSLPKILIAVLLSHVCVPAASSAQTSSEALPQSWSAAKGQVAAREIVRVVDTAGTTTRGKLIEMTDDAIEVLVSGSARSIHARDIRLIQRQKSDSLVNGVLIGAAVGAIPGIYWLVADPNECTGLCGEDYAAIGVGALVGALLDRVIKKKVTVYDAAARKTTKIILSPLLVRDRRGLQVAVTF